jgi:hypothetical protein
MGLSAKAAAQTFVDAAQGTLDNTTSKVLLAPTRCSSYLEVVGEIQANNPIELNYNPSSITSGRLGYQFTGTTSSTKITTTTQTLASIAIPSAGVWYVEYQFNPVGLGGSVYCLLSISTTNNTHDSGRLITKAVNTGNYTHNAGYPIVLGAAATVYFIGNQGTGGTASSTSSFMRATRIA